jgi:GH25 family lysozyme M1 (1,4-beta-N-acetylmuramidase)
MRARRLVGWTGALIAATSLGAVGLTALLAPAAPAVRPAVARTTDAVHLRHVRRFNVAAAHSPQVLRQLAKGPAVSKAAISTTAYTAATPPAGVPGVDVASFQESGGITWATVAKAGIKFAAIKVTEGNYYVNPFSRADLAAAQRAGLAIMAYHFAIPNLTGPDSSAVAQADFAIYHASYAYGRAPLMLDIEYDPYYLTDGSNSQCYGLSPSAMVAWVQAFTAEVLSKTGQSPIIYTPKSWWDICTGGSTRFGQDMLWVPFPGSTPPASTDLPAGWSTLSTWGIWQYTIGTVSGISGDVDLDVLNKNLPILLADGAQQYPASSSTPPAQVQQVQVQSSVPVTSYTLTQPPGLGLMVNVNGVSSGAVSGAVPATPGSYPVTVTGTPTAGSISESTTFDVDAYGTDTVNSLGSLSTVAGSPVLRQIHVTDSVSGTTQLFSAAGLPPGLTMDSGGLITGFPAKAGAYPVTVTVIDSLGATGSATFTWTVTAAPGTGLTGHVQLNLGGKCLTDAGNQSANGTPADIWTCDTRGAQQWTYAQDNTLRIHGKCLTNPAVNWVVRLEPCSGSDSQEWELMYPQSVNPSAGVKPLALVNPASGSCLSDPGSATNGTRVRAASCDGSQNQVWTLPAGEVVSQVPGRCVTDNRDSTANGTAIVLRVCSNSGAQQWIAGPDGTVRIHGKCLNVPGGGTSTGTPLNLWTCNASGAQQWRLLPDGPGIDLVNPQSGLCLTDPGNSTAYGIRLRIVTCTSAAGQRWRLP